MQSTRLPLFPVLLLTFLALTYVGFSGSVVLGVSGVALPGWVYDQLPLTVSSTSAIGVLWAAWKAPKEDRSAWLPFALGLSAYMLGDQVYNLYKHLEVGGEPPFPSWADAFYLLFAPLITLGLWRLLRPTPGPQLWRLLLDISTIVITVLVLLWHFIYADAIRTSENLTGLLVNASYPLQDSLMISLVLLIAFQERVRLSRAAIVWLNLGLLASFVADVAYATLLPEPYSLTNQVMDVLFTFCQGSFCIVAVWSVLRPGESRATLPAVTRVMSPYLAIGICFGLIVWEVLNLRGQDRDLLRLAGDVVGTGLVTFSVVLRQNLAFRENAGLNRELSHQATHDVLTNLPNRALLDVRLDEALSAAAVTGKRVALLYLDLDRFKTINDGLGHETGDELLRVAAKRLGTQLCPSDTLARQGGDEFMVVLPGLSGEEQAQQVADRLLRSLNTPLVLTGRTLVVTASIGLAMYPRDALDGPTLRVRADTAMYGAKANGRNSVQQYTSEMNSGLSSLEYEQALRTAVAQGLFELHYQPIIGAADPAGVELLGVEALVRWRHDAALVSPARFIPLAEETGLIVPLGVWILHTALRQLANWDAAGLSIPRLAVNVSARQFLSGDLVATVCQALRSTGIAARRLTLELTESMVAQDVTGTIDQLTALRSLGVRIAVDDFGTGHSSLSLLKRVPRDILKIDRSFVSGLPSDLDSEAMVQMILALARTLKLEVVAEGVETPEQWATLRRLGCAAAQGYYFSRPLEVADLAAWLERLAPSAQSQPA